MKKRRLLLVLLGGSILFFLGIWQEQAGHAVAPPGRQEQEPTVATEPDLVAALEASSARIEPVLLKQLLEGTRGEMHRFIVEMVDQADLTSFSQVPIRAGARQQVLSLLKDTAQHSQTGVLALLQDQQAAGHVQEIHSFWVFDGLAVVADADTLLALARRPDVRIVREDRWRRWVEPLSPIEDTAAASVQGDVQWNIALVQADLAWSALGLRGTGVTVAILDTGVDWEHPALQAQYRGYKPNGLSIHQGNWFCTTDEGYLYPTDGSGHGTHVAGTAVGGQDDTGQSIGVAPGAHWIAVKTLNDGGYGYDSWIHAAFEWLLAPAGDPALAPDVVNCSWGSPASEDRRFQPDLQALLATGIVPVFSAGNIGPGAASLNSPGSNPEVLTVGATDNLDMVTTFSSRGPSPWGEIKPEVVAPGAQIRSTFPGGTYHTLNGTSMAAPHVTGLVALLLEADPSLTVDRIEQIIESTARHLGDPVPNNNTGWGRIDAYQAAAVAVEAGFVSGQVFHQPDQQPLSTARISARDHVGTRVALVEADEQGSYWLALPPGQYSLTFEAFGYAPRILGNIVVETDSITPLDVTLAPLPTGMLWGQVTGASSGGPVAAVVAAPGTPAQATSDPQTGWYSLSLPADTYAIDASTNGYRRYTMAGVEIVAGQDTRLDMALTPAPTLLLVDSGRWYYGSQVRYFEQALADRDYVYDLWPVQNLASDLPVEEDLVPYDVTIWSSPFDAPGLIGAGETISRYLMGGGNLFLTGQDVGFWDGGLSSFGYSKYLRELLKTEAIEDDAGRADLVGFQDDILQSLSLPLNGPDSAQNQFSPDAIALLDPRDATIIGAYQDEGYAAMRARDCNIYRAVYLAAGLEGLGDQVTRAEVMDRALGWLSAPHPDVDLDLYPVQQDQVVVAGSILTYTVELRNLGQSRDLFALDLAPSNWDVSLWNSSFTQPLTGAVGLDACQAQVLGVQVVVPPGVSWNVTDVVTLTVRSTSDPARAAQAVFRSKTPAPILLVDDHRWRDVLDSYRAALEANHLPYDLWRLDPNPLPDVHSPTLDRLQNYPLVIWFTAYDWFATLTPGDESRLAAYLDGGGRLLFSSQDYLLTSGFTNFAPTYLGVAGYSESLTSTQVVRAVGSPIGGSSGVMDMTYPYANWSDALRPSSDARIAMWGQHGQPVALTLDRAGFKTAFFSFPLETLDAQDMATVASQSVRWLSPLGDSTFVGDPSVAAPGDPLPFTLIVKNTGPRPLDAVVLSNTLPASTTYLEGSLQGPLQFDPATSQFFWTGSLDPGESVTMNYRLLLDPGVPDGTAIENVAYLEDESGLAFEWKAVTRVNTPDLSGSAKAVNSLETWVGRTLTYSIHLENQGLRSAPASLIDPRPLGTSYVPGAAWASSGQLTLTSESLLWTGRIPPGQGVTITLPVVAGPDTAGLYVWNRAALDDGWGDTRAIEAYAWVKRSIYMPVVYK